MMGGKMSLRDEIKRALGAFSGGKLSDNAANLFKTLGYESQRTLNRPDNSPDALLKDFDTEECFDREKARLNEWETADFLFQLTAHELSLPTTDPQPAAENRLDRSVYKSYLFFAVRLKGDEYPRGALARMTREINRLFSMPSFVLFQHGRTLTFSVIDRRPNKIQPERDVLEKVTLIKDIDVQQPHRAHLDILADLSLDILSSTQTFENIMQFHEAWRKTLDASELNKRFFKEIADWHFWAVKTAAFPEDGDPDDSQRRSANGVIRLITRLIFVWFLKEKQLVPEELFDKEEAGRLLNSLEDEESSYYKAILQNLFFATLNQEMNQPGKKKKRDFRNDGQHYNITHLYRYRRLFSDPQAALKLFESIPFLNGGLFECLDKPDPENPKKVLRVDGFSDRSDNQIDVPNELFFAEKKSVDLNEAYGTENKLYSARGVLRILERYKFTVAENTPIEEEVALDPELLGRVFENLFAAYNTETAAAARKEQGSFYTPRGMVNYMVDESLVAYLKNSVNDEERLRKLTAYNDEPHGFADDETERLIEAIDRLKIIDPACGSGAFPMGILHKLVHMLGKLDPLNEQWKQRQIARVDNAIKEVEQIDVYQSRDHVDGAIKELEQEKADIEEAFARNELDYPRKLFLINKCIHGADIQPIAAQIAKLRFFISLIIDQKTDDKRENRGVRPLPNLETRFVAANTLIDLERPEGLHFSDIERKKKDLKAIRDKHFTVRDPRTKEKYRKKDEELRKQISELILKKIGAAREFSRETAEMMANWDPYDQNAVADFFNAEWMFGVEQFDIVIGNPPYVRQEKIDKKLKALLKDKKRYTAFTGKSDLYISFYERGFQLLKERGVHTFICSNSWLDVQYGAPLQEYLLTNAAEGVVCHSEAERAFETADVNTIVSLFRKGKPDELAQMRFITFKGAVGDAEQEEPQERAPSYEQLLQEGTRNGKYAGGKWGGRYLRAPDIYWTILKKGEGKLKPLSSLAEARIGVKTGANEFFFLDEAQIQKWGIEPKFLHPGVKNSSDCKTIRIDPRRLHLQLFMCHTDEEALTGTAALEYIRWGESQGFHQRPSCRGRPRWYDLGERRKPTLVFNRTVHSTARTLYAPDGCYASNTFHEVHADSDLTLPLCAALNSTPFQLMVNTMGRSNLGGGALAIEAYELLDLQCLDPKTFAFDDAALFDSSAWDAVKLSDARRALDSVIFDALHLTQGERDGVYEAVVRLVENRLRKAKSARGRSR